MRALLVFACLLLTACAPSSDVLVQDAHQSGNELLAIPQFDALGNVTPAENSQCAEGQWLVCSTSVDEESCSCIIDSVAREKLRRIESISQQPIS